MKRNIAWKKVLLAGTVSLGMAALQPVVQAQPHRGGGRAGGGGRAVHIAPMFRSGGAHRGVVRGGASFHAAPSVHGSIGRGRTFEAGNDRGRDGHFHGRGVWFNGHFGYWDGGLFINLNAPFYGGPGYYGYPAYGGEPAGVYVHFHGTVQGVDVNNGYLGVVADNGMSYNIQTGNAGSFGPGERVVVRGTAFGNNVEPSVLREEHMR